MNPLLLESCRRFLHSIPGNLNYILPEQLAAELKDDPDKFFILDNRTPEAYASGHIPGAVNIWIKDALNDENIERIAKDKKIVVCCWVGHTASQLLTVLQLLGYDAVGLKYGMGEPAFRSEKVQGWLSLELPTKAGGEP